MDTVKKLKEKFIRVRNQSLKLCEPLAIEDYVVQPIVDVSPPKWHLAHTTWFFENLLLSKFVAGYQFFNPDYNYFFNSYYESLGERVIRPNRGNMTRPTVGEVMEFRKFVDQKMLDFFDSSQEKSDEMLYIIEIGLQHEQQHQELLMYDIKYILGHNPIFPVYKEKANHTQAPDSAFYSEKYLEVSEGVYEIGYQGNEFHYDNEKGVHKTYINGFKFLDRLVTNQEYLQFINDGGYQNFKYWLSDGWDWVNQEKITAPLYWHKMNDQWQQYTLSGLSPVALSEPVTHINYYEADAFAKWKGKRLLTEFEWEVAAKKYAQNMNGNFVENEIYHPAARRNDSLQMFGDTWEWTSSAYLPYPFYQQVDGALGEYNGKFMVNQMVLRGGSCVTPADHIRRTYRNFFHSHLRWHFTGIRLAQDLSSNQ